MDAQCTVHDVCISIASKCCPLKKALLKEALCMRGEDGGQDGYVVLLSQCLGRLQGLLHIDLTVSEGFGRGGTKSPFMHPMPLERTRRA